MKASRNATRLGRGDRGRLAKGPARADGLKQKLAPTTSPRRAATSGNTAHPDAPDKADACLAANRIFVPLPRSARAQTAASQSTCGFSLSRTPSPFVLFSRASSPFQPSKPKARPLQIPDFINPVGKLSGDTIELSAATTTTPLPRSSPPCLGSITPLVNLAIFWLLSASLLLIPSLVPLVSCIQLTYGRYELTDSPFKGAIALPWNASPQQVIFYVGLIVICAWFVTMLSSSPPALAKRPAAVTTRCVANQTFLCIFLLASTVILISPEVIQRSDLLTVNPEYSTGNCTDLFSALDEKELIGLNQTCPQLMSAADEPDSLYVQISHELAEQAGTNGVSLIRSIVDTIKPQNFRLSFEEFTNHQQNATMIFQKCLPKFMDLVCNVAFLRCERSGCKLDNQTTSCKFNKAVHELRNCVETSCTKDRDCDPEALAFQKLGTLDGQSLARKVKSYHRSPSFARMAKRYFSSSMDRKVLEFLITDAQSRLFSVRNEADARSCKTQSYQTAISTVHPHNSGGELFAGCFEKGILPCGTGFRNRPRMLLRRGIKFCCPAAIQQGAGQDIGRDSHILCDSHKKNHRFKLSLNRYDSKCFYAGVVLTLSVILLWSARRPLVFYFPSPRTRNARVFSFFVGFSIALLVFLGGVSNRMAAKALTENAHDEHRQYRFHQKPSPLPKDLKQRSHVGITMSTKEEDTERVLLMWEAGYYIISLLCVVKSGLILVHGKSFCLGGCCGEHTCRTGGTTLPLSTTTPSSSKPKISSCCSSIKSMMRRSFKCVHRFYRSLASSRGLYNLHFLLAREVFETSVQFLGIVETAHVADASLVYLRVCVLSANLIILPLATVCEWMIWGRIAGTAAIYFVEVIFDRLFVLVAVYQQATSNELLVNSSGSIMSHLSSHLPSLMPAVMFIIVQSPAFVTLAETADNRRTIRQHRRHAIAAGKGVRWTCFREMQEHYSAILIQRWARHRLVVIKRQRAQKKTCFWQRGCPKVRASYIFCAILVVFFTLGVSIFMYVNYAISGQEDICEAQIGPVARCVWPKMYFEDSGFFGETGCHFERVKSIECFSGRLRLGRMDRVSTLPEAPEIYETMTELRKINLTGCPLLESVPSSWSRIPHLTSIDVSQNKMLRTFPVQLCVNASSNLRDKGSISVAGTVASKTLNWTGQFMPWASDNSPSLPAMSEACLSAFQDSVTVLDLSHNNLSTGKIINGLEWITDWGNLKRINFGHNRIDRLDKELVDLTRRVHIHSGSIGLAANPVKNVNLVNSDIEQIAGVLNDLKDSYLPSSTLLKKVEIVGIANGYLLDIFSGLRHNPLFNEAKFGVRELVLEFVELDEGLEFAEGGDLFEGMANLKSLTIRRSRIGAVGKETFASLQNLNKLELVANDLANVEVGTFAGLPNLEHLILGKDLEHIVKRRDWGLSDTVKVEFVAHSASALSASNLL